MHNQYFNREEVREEVINLLSELRISAGYDPMRYHDDSPIHTPGTTHDMAEDANIIMALESRFAVQFDNESDLLDRLGTVGRLVDYIVWKMGQSR